MTDSQKTAIRINEKNAYLKNNDFVMVDGVLIATMKRKPSKLQKLEAALARAQDNYNACIKNGMTEMALRFEAAIKKTSKQIAKAMAA